MMIWRPTTTTTVDEILGNQALCWAWGHQLSEPQPHEPPSFSDTALRGGQCVWDTLCGDYLVPVLLPGSDAVGAHLVWKRRLEMGELTPLGTAWNPEGMEASRQMLLPPSCRGTVPAGICMAPRIPWDWSPLSTVLALVTHASSLFHPPYSLLFLPLGWPSKWPICTQVLLLGSVSGTPKLR